MMVFRNHADALETELIRSLFHALSPTLIMAFAFMVGGALMVWETGDVLLLGMLAGGTMASLARLAAVWLPRAELRRPDLTVERARVLQRRFTVAYFSFAIMLGLFGDQAMRSASAEVHMLMICMLVGYAAGVAAGVGLRPRIAIPSMLVAIVPALTVMVAKADVLYWATALMASAFLVGGVKSVRERHDRAAQSIGGRITFAMLARQDALTELPNRLALREWYDDNVAFRDGDGPIAVHYLDLNGFKPVNDAYGHPVGDALLAAVGKRIARAIREEDMAARLGGDEFAVIQRSIDKPEDVVLLANRLQAAIARPFKIDDLTVTISTCVGYVISSDRSDDLEHLLTLADEALYTSKRGSRGVIGYAIGGKPDVAREAA